MDSRLEFLKRLRIGKLKSEHYKSLFADFNGAIFINLEYSENILNNINCTISQDEMIESADSFLKSELLTNVYMGTDDTSKSYIFTDDYEYCGMFLVYTKEAIKKSLKIARQDSNHTFILDFNKEFFIRINYYDQSHHDYPLKYDISLRSRGKG
ncbi:MAG: hypothetical protein LBE36_09035 [Flavobacteriaceae bacterium]|jgi:hypothetical protein|nr:hypothetical protein [Flavobacteriaceae bacterium]